MFLLDQADTLGGYHIGAVAKTHRLLSSCGLNADKIGHLKLLANHDMSLFDHYFARLMTMAKSTQSPQLPSRQGFFGDSSSSWQDDEWQYPEWQEESWHDDSGWSDAPTDPWSDAAWHTDAPYDSEWGPDEPWLPDDEEEEEDDDEDWTDWNGEEEHDPFAGKAHKGKGQGQRNRRQAQGLWQGQEGEIRQEHDVWLLSVRVSQPRHCPLPMEGSRIQGQGQVQGQAAEGQGCMPHLRLA